MKHKSEFLGTEKISSLLLKMSLPTTIGMIVMTLYTIIDSIFIGQKVGALGLAAVGIVFPFLMFVISISMGIGLGASSIISRKLGEKDYKHAQEVFDTFITFLLITSVTLSVLGIIFIDKLLIFLGSSEAILPYAKAFLLPLLIGLIFQMFSASLTNIVRSFGSAKTAMFSMIFSGILNAILDYIFLFVYNFGMAGAAWATVISQVTSFVFLIWHFRSGKAGIHIEIKMYNPKILKSIFTIGFPSFIRQASMSVIGILVNHMMKLHGGDVAIAGYGIIFRILMILVMPAMGIMQGSQPIIGYNYGAKNFKRVKDVLKLGIIVSTSIILMSFVIIYSFPEIFIKLFTNDLELIDFTRKGLLIMLVGFPLIGFQFMSQGYFQAIGKAKEALILSLLRQTICFLPLVLILPIFFGLNGIWYSYPISDLISSIITYFMMQNEFKLLI